MAQSMRIVIGSRGSQLALWQANWVRDQLVAAGHAVEIRIIRTTGDRLADASLVRSGTKGLFIKEIEEALAEKAVDLAVHSLKDLPTEQPPGLCVAAVPRRDDPRDVFVSRDGRRLAELPRGSRVGTSSLRRQSQLRHLRPDLEVMPLRGNVDTRLKKLQRGDCHALILAAAGIHRLGLEDRVTEYLTVDQMCPAVGQGALAIEIRQDDECTASAVEPLDDVVSHRAVHAERAALRYLGGGCSVPVAAYAVAQGERLRLIGVVASPDGGRLARAEALGSIDRPEALGAALAEDLLQQGAGAILKSGAEM